LEKTWEKTSGVLDGDRSVIRRWPSSRLVRCVSATTTLGLTDNSTGGPNAIVTINADGADLFGPQAFAYGPGTSHQTINIAGHLRIRLQEDWNAGSPEVGFGEAQIRCLW